MTWRRIDGALAKRARTLTLACLATALQAACGGDDATSRSDVIDGTSGFEVADSSVSDQVTATDDLATTGQGDGVDGDGGEDAMHVGDGVVGVDAEACTPACPVGELCDDGACVCAPGFTRCPGAGCVDLARDPENCHACGAPAAAETCNGEDDDCSGVADDHMSGPTAPCEASNALGTCVGAWTCDGAGWSCTVAAPTAEVCNDADDDCNGATDEGFRDLVSGIYESDVACGACGNDCTADLGPDDHAHGTCDVTGAGGPTCALVCCTAGDPHPGCDGSDWADTDHVASNGCETRVVHACATEGDCAQSEVCVDHACVPNSAGGPCSVDADCAVGDVCVGGICGCTGDVYRAEAVPPNVLIVLDRSSSMTQSIVSGGLSKWEIAKAAVRQITEAYDHQVRFGLKLFPGVDQAGTTGPDCGPGVVWLDPAADNADPINDFLAASGTSHGTPIAEALHALLDYDGLQDTARHDFVILITDGQANCGDPVPEVAALYAATPSIETFVIGFGGEVDPDQLSAMANAGGTAQGADGYYQADDPMALGQALTDIVGNVLGCDYVLDTVPPDPSALGVYFDRVEQPLDAAHASGWDYSPQGNHVTFYGSSCSALLSGSVKDLVFVYGCPDPIIIGGP